MPTYDFVCDKCEEKFEVSISVKDYDRCKKQDCPKCNKSDNVRRSYTPPGIKFGAGFFKDGYRSAKDVRTTDE